MPTDDGRQETGRRVLSDRSTAREIIVRESPTRIRAYFPQTRLLRLAMIESRIGEMPAEVWNRDCRRAARGSRHGLSLSNAVSR